MSSFAPLIKQAATRIMAREVPALRRLARANLRSADGFNEAVADWYEEHRGYVQRQVEPVLQTMAPEIYAAALEEVGADLVDPTAFVRSYAETFAVRHTEGGKNQLAKLVEKTPTDECLVAVEERLLEWEERTPDKIASEESVKGGSAFAKAAWSAVGVGYLIWRSNSDACSLCRQLNGRRIAINSFFLVPGDEVDPHTEGMAKMAVRRKIGHAPLHGGCVCSISAG